VLVHNIFHPGLPTSTPKFLFEALSKSVNIRRISHLHCGILQLIYKTIPSDERYILDSRKSQDGRYIYFNSRNEIRSLFWWLISCDCLLIYTLLMGKTTIDIYGTGLRWNRTRVNYRLNEIVTEGVCQPVMASDLYFM
jgi:hypothetical protein